MESEADVVKVDGLAQRGGGAVVEVRGTGGEASQDGAFDFADMVEVAVDQSLAEVGGGFAVVGGSSAGCVDLADGDLRQIADVEAAEVRRAIGRAGIARADV